MPDSHLLPIGRIRKAHGIKGEVSVDFHADSPSLLDGGVFLRRSTEAPEHHEIISFRSHHGTLLIRFASVPDRTAAELLRGYELLIPKERLPEPDDNAIYIHEIMGLSVFAIDSSGDESFWGTIRAVVENSGQELWTISLPDAADVLFPATPEFVASFDLEARRVTIVPPPGLLELYRG